MPEHVFLEHPEVLGIYRATIYSSVQALCSANALQRFRIVPVCPACEKVYRTLDTERNRLLSLPYSDLARDTRWAVFPLPHQHIPV
jgi:hypothetical protein